MTARKQSQTPEQKVHEARNRAAIRAQIKAAMDRAGYTMEELASALGQRGIAVSTLRTYMGAGLDCPCGVEYTVTRLLGFKGFLFTIDYGDSPPYSAIVPPKLIRPDALRREARKTREKEREREKLRRRAARVASGQPKVSPSADVNQLLSETANEQGLSKR